MQPVASRDRRTPLAQVVLALVLVAALAFAAFLFGPARAWAALQERGALVVGGEPKALLPSTDGSRLYVSDFAGESVAEVDLASGLVVRRFPVPGSPVGLALTADGSTLYAASYFGGAVYRFEVATGQLQATAHDLGDPWALALVSGPQGRSLLAVTEHHADALTFLDPLTFVRVAGLPTAYYPYQIEIDTAARRLYVESYGGRDGGELLAVDLETLSPLWTQATGQGSFDVRRSPTDGTLVVTDFVGHTLTQVSAAGAVLTVRSVPGGPKEGVFSAAGDELYVALQTADLLNGYDPGSGALRSSVRVGSLPGPLAWLSGPGGPVLAVGNQGDGTVSLLSSGEPVPEFADVLPSHRFHREIRVLALRSALGGYLQPDGATVFQPDAPLKRAQLAKILVASLGLHTDQIEAAAVSFADVPAETGGYPFDYVQEAARYGIVTGQAGAPRVFQPYQDVTRIQLVRMAVRAAAAAGSPLPATPGPSPFYDIRADDPELPTILAAYQAGLVSGIPGADGHLRLQPYGAATRGHTARVVFNLLGALGGATP